MCDDTQKKSEAKNDIQQRINEAVDNINEKLINIVVETIEIKFYESMVKKFIYVSTSPRHNLGKFLKYLEQGLSRIVAEFKNNNNHYIYIEGRDAMFSITSDKTLTCKSLTEVSEILCTHTYKQYDVMYYYNQFTRRLISIINDVVSNIATYGKSFIGAYMYFIIIHATICSAFR